MTVSRDTLFEAFTVVPPHAGFEQADRFLQAFRVNREEMPTIYTRRVPALLAALRSTDEAERERAESVFREVEFERADMPLLRQALLVKYGDEEDGLSMIRSNILDELVSGDDPDSVITFVRAAYSALKPGQEHLKYTLLTLLVQLETDSAWALGRQLLAAGLPKEGNPYRFFVSIRSSAKEAAALLPLLIKGSNDSLHRQLLAQLATYLDSDSLLDRSLFQSYIPLYLADAETSYRHAKANPEETYVAYEWAGFVSLFNTPECIALQHKFLTIEDPDVRFVSLVGLLRHRQKVDPAMISKLAADKAYRLQLYERMEQLGLLAQFPKAWSGQRQLAESELYGIASEELDELLIELVGERVAEFQGRKQKFFLFHVYAEGEPGYLGIAGPYGNGTKGARGSITNLVWDEDYERSKVDRLFKKYLEEAGALEEGK